MLTERAEYVGIFEIYDNPGYETDYLRCWCRDGNDILDLPGVSLERTDKNIIMAAQKLLMANAVYPRIDRLVITSQTATPVDSETSYSGTIYTSVLADEFSRSNEGNPYQVQWNITSDSANGTWSSLILITAGGEMINRALTSMTKISGTTKIVQFTGSVV